jgi:hypothetical protein
MVHYANPFANQVCKCGSGQLRLVHCQECTPYTPTCKHCFVRSHRQMRRHWAWIWDVTKGFYSNIDYSEVLPESADAVLQLGHALDEDPCSVYADPQAIAVIHSNGVHNTKVRFCCCSDTERAVQLAHMGLFPGSPTYPQTAFTFALLKEFQYHTRQSRCSAFDWIVALRRMTDDVALHAVSVCSKYFFSCVCDLGVLGSIQILLTSFADLGEPHHTHCRRVFPESQLLSVKPPFRCYPSLLPRMSRARREHV